MGLFDLQGKYYKMAYAIKAMGQMLDTPKRLAVAGTAIFGFAALAGRSADDQTVQILSSSCAIPGGYKPKQMFRPADQVAKPKPAPANPIPPPPNELPLRTDIV